MNSISRGDRAILRLLAQEVADLAARPEEEQKRELWYRHNALEATRPVIFCDPENGWNEIIRPDDLVCAGEMARRWEFHLRREIFWGREMGDDRVIEPFFTVSHVYTESGWGMSERRIGGHLGGAYTWDSPLKSYEDFSRLRFPQITVNYAATERLVELACETFGDLLPVRLKTKWFWTVGLTWTLVNLRGLQAALYDMVDRPEDLHRLMTFLSDGTMARLEFLEREGLLSLDNDGSYVGSGGFGWTHELPAPGFDGRKVRLCDIWGFAESQETVGVSPQMFAEFVLPYQMPLLSRFGLNCYGCCEPVDRRWPYIKDIPNLRRVSVSPWSDREAMAQNLGDRYILSMKPNPAQVAAPTFDDEAIRRDLRRDLKATRGCRVEVILKDCHTIGREPERVTRWVRIAREEAERV